jgi:hypothetical protein
VTLKTAFHLSDRLREEVQNLGSANLKNAKLEDAALRGTAFLVFALAS